MNYSSISKKLLKIEEDFKIALHELENDDIFENKTHIIWDREKKNIYKKWKIIKWIFKRLKFMIKLWWLNYFFRKNYNNFLINYYSIKLYYYMLLNIQKTFKYHEKFIRQFLNETYNENYSTIARYVYTPKFLYYLYFPKKIIYSIENKVDKNIIWMIYKDFEIKDKYKFDYKNIYFHVKYKKDNIILKLSKFFWIKISNIRFKFSKKWLINKENTEKFYKIAKAWDILLTRQTFVATNMGIPWFWKHMWMYLWTWEYLQKYISKK